jgi:hypothetical protein
LPLSRAAAARTWINLFERTANSWAEFESMLARLILAAIVQKCLEVEAEREEEERKAKVAMHSSEHDDLLLEELLADDDGDKKKKKSKKKKKKADVEETKKEPEEEEEDAEEAEAQAAPEDADEQQPEVEAATPAAAPEDADGNEDAETVLTSACWSTVSRKKQRKKPQPEEVNPPSLTHARADSSSTIKSKGSQEVATTPSLSHARADSSSTWKSKGSQEAGADAHGTGPEKADQSQAASAAISPHDSTRASSRGSTPTPKAAVGDAVGQPSCATSLRKSDAASSSLPWSSGVSDGKHFWAFKLGTESAIVASMHRTFLSVTRQVTRRGRRASI